MTKMNKAIKGMKAEDMSAGMIIITMGGMQVEDDSLGIQKTDHDNQSIATRA